MKLDGELLFWIISFKLQRFLSAAVITNSHKVKISIFCFEAESIYFCGAIKKRFLSTKLCEKLFCAQNYYFTNSIKKVFCGFVQFQKK